MYVYAKRYVYVQVYSNVTRDIGTMFCVILYANRVCNGNLTLPQKTNPCGAFGGSPVVMAVRPDPVDLISNPLECFETICNATDLAQDVNRPCSGRIDIFNTLAFPHRSIPILPKTESIRYG